MDSGKLPRPPEIEVPREDSGVLKRTNSLLPGMVRTPAQIVRLTEWAAPGKNMWEEPGVTTGASVLSPLARYGRQNEVWGSSSGSPFLGEEVAASGAGEATAFEPAQKQQHSGYTVAAATLQGLSQNESPAPPIRPQTTPFTTNANIYNAHHHVYNTAMRGRGGGSSSTIATTTHQPYAIRPNFLTVQTNSATDTEAENGLVESSAPASTSHVQGSFSASVPSLEDKQVVQRIIASAGLPLSMHSLVDYIREGQPHLEENAGSVNATHHHRNFPNLIDPAQPQDGVHNSTVSSAGFEVMGRSYETGRAQVRSSGTQGYTASSTSTLAGSDFYKRQFKQQPQQQQLPQQQQQQPPQQQQLWSGKASDDWNVQSSTPPMRSYTQTTSYTVRNAPALLPSTASFPTNTTANGNSRLDLQNVGNDVGFSATASRGNKPAYLQRRPFQQQPQVTSMQYTATTGAVANPDSHSRHHPTHQAGNRFKSESEILSDLLHFYANYFPPPPPPRIPSGARRARAALWYHYASKWDITHRLPPPPRTPLPEIETGRVAQLPELTKVPYNGNDWLYMCERWFDVMQTLFDYPEENVGAPVDIQVVLNNAVTI